MIRLVTLVAIAATVSTVATAQPVDPASKFAPARVNAIACVRQSAPAAHIQGIADISAFYAFAQSRCFPRFETELTKLDAGDAAPGTFRLIVRDEWSAFQVHLMTGR